MVIRLIIRAKRALFVALFYFIKAAKLQYPDLGNGIQRSTIELRSNAVKRYSTSSFGINCAKPPTKNNLFRNYVDLAVNDINSNQLELYPSLIMVVLLLSQMRKAHSLLVIYRDNKLLNMLFPKETMILYCPRV